MKHLVFENAGEIDWRSISTFGCSVKESKNPIGFFGTGLKFCIAILLRLNCPVIVQSGVNQLSAEARQDSIRGKEFGFVYLGGNPLGFTTELGKTWQAWMAYRELYCNAKDEAEHSIYVCDEMPAPVAGKTRFITSGDEIMAAHAKRTDFILEGEPSFRLGTIEVFDRQTNAFFYKGIKVMEFQSPCLYTYNETAHVSLTEDRTVKEPYAITHSISRAVLEFAERSVLERLLVADRNHVEHNLDFHGWTATDPSADFFKTVSDLQRSSLVKINPTALRLWREKSGGFIDPRRVAMTKIQSLMLEKAIVFCEASGFALRDEYPVIVVESLGETATLALADKIGKQIFLTQRLFEMCGTKGVASALIEEYIHLRFGLSDCSREMQNFIFDKMVSLAEELRGEPL